MNIRVLMVNTIVFICVFQAKLAVQKLRSPKTAPQDILSEVHMKWVEAGSEEEVYMLSTKAALLTR
jgi:hypothetical protein